MSEYKLIVSNWKMNLNFNEAKSLVKRLMQLKLDNSNIKQVVCPQFLLIPLISDLTKSSKIEVGAQDCHFEENGAFTGENSVKLIKKINCKYIIVGHSERRQHQKETNDLVKRKVINILKNKIKPILCIGESLEDRENGKYLKFLKNQLIECIPEALSEIIIAYEPIWSIGTGFTPSIEEIFEVQNFIKTFLIEYKEIKKLTFLYGGSINSNNFNKIINNSYVNGALIGGASLRFQEMKKILTIC